MSLIDFELETVSHPVSVLSKAIISTADGAQFEVPALVLAVVSTTFKDNSMHRSNWPLGRLLTLPSQSANTLPTSLSPRSVSDESSTLSSSTRTGHERRTSTVVSCRCRRSSLPSRFSSFPSVGTLTSSPSLGKCVSPTISFRALAARLTSDAPLNSTKVEECWTRMQGRRFQRHDREAILSKRRAWYSLWCDPRLCLYVPSVSSRVVILI